MIFLLVLEWIVQKNAVVLRRIPDRLRVFVFEGKDTIAMGGTIGVKALPTLPRLVDPLCLLKDALEENSIDPARKETRTLRAVARLPQSLNPSKAQDSAQALVRDPHQLRYL